MQLATNLDAVRDRLRQRDRRPEVVKARGKDGYRSRTVTLEVVVEPALDAFQIGLQRAALVVRHVAAVRLLR